MSRRRNVQGWSLPCPWEANSKAVPPMARRGFQGGRCEDSRSMASEDNRVTCAAKRGTEQMLHGTKGSAKHPRIPSHCAV